MRVPRRIPYGSFRRLPSLAIALLLLVSLTVSSLAATAVRPRGTRLLGIDVNTGSDGDYAKAFTAAKGAGMQVTSLVVYWDELETAPGVYAPEPNWLSIANLYYPSQNTQVLLTVVPIDTAQNRLPEDLAGLPLDDPIVINRFKGVLNYVFSEIPSLQLAALSIGSEIDIKFGTDAVVWGQYQRFYAAVAAHARTLRPGLKVGVQTTYDGTLTWAAGPVAVLNQASDVVLISYYPLYANFTVKPASVVKTDWAALVAAVPSKPIMFAQIGYPSAALNLSGLSKQASFVDQVFEAWDLNYTRVSAVVFVRLNDCSDAQVAAWTNSYYGITDSRFAAFLKTLGLRTELGVDKTAFGSLKRQARARGW